MEELREEERKREKGGEKERKREKEEIKREKRREEERKREEREKKREHKREKCQFSSAKKWHFERPNLQTDSKNPAKHPPKWWMRHLIHAFVTFGWVLSRF